MFVVIDNVDTGKTKKLLGECIKNNGLFVCKHPERVADKCLSYGYSTIPTYMGYEEFIAKMKNQKIENVYIDELANFTTYLVDLKGYALTKEN